MQASTAENGLSKALIPTPQRGWRSLADAEKAARKRSHRAQMRAYALDMRGLIAPDAAGQLPWKDRIHRAVHRLETAIFYRNLANA